MSQYTYQKKQVTFDQLPHSIKEAKLKKHREAKYRMGSKEHSENDKENYAQGKTGLKDINDKVKEVQGGLVETAAKRKQAVDLAKKQEKKHNKSVDKRKVHLGPNGQDLIVDDWEWFAKKMNYQDNKTLGQKLKQSFGLKRKRWGNLLSAADGHPAFTHEI